MGRPRAPRRICRSSAGFYHRVALDSQISTSSGPGSGIGSLPGGDLVHGKSS